MEVNLGNKLVNVKTAGKSTLEKVILEIIKTKHPKREEILNFYFKKNKMKPHKKLNGELSFIECSIKYDDHDLLCNYVKNLTLCAPSFNIINLCVEYNKVELLKKYIKEKRISIEQCVNENTPLITALKNKHVECFNILLENGCKIYQQNSKGSSPICNLFADILIENDKGGITEENKRIYERFIDGLLPKKFIISYEQLKDELKDELKVVGDKTKKHDYSVFEKLKDDIKMLINKEDMFDSDLFDKLTKSVSENRGISDVACHYINKYNILYSNCETSKLIRMANNGLDTFVNIILNRRPYMLYLNFIDYKVIIHLFNTNNENVINNIMTNFSHVILNDDELLHYLTFTGKMDNVKTLLSKYPECATKLESSGKTLIEAVVTSKKIEDKDKIEHIDYFINMGVPVNSENHNGDSTLEVAIQYSTKEVTEHLIKHTNDEFKKRDTMRVASRFERLEILKMLVDNDFYIERAESTNAPACIYPALRLSNYPMIKYILEEQRFNIEESQMKHLFGFAKMRKCTKNILCLLDDNYKNNHCDKENLVDDEKYEVVRLHGMFSNFIEKYNFDQCEILSHAKMIIMMLLKIVNNNTNTIIKKSFFDQEERFIRMNNLRKGENEIDQNFMIILTYENIDTLTSADINEIFTWATEGNVDKNSVDTYKKVLLECKDKLEHYSSILIELLQLILNQDEEDSNFTYCDCCGMYCEAVPENDNNNNNNDNDNDDNDNDNDDNDNNYNDNNKNLDIIELVKDMLNDDLQKPKHSKHKAKKTSKKSDSGSKIELINDINKGNNNSDNDSNDNNKNINLIEDINNEKYPKIKCNDNIKTELINDINNENNKKNNNKNNNYNYNDSDNNSDNSSDNNKIIKFVEDVSKNTKLNEQTINAEEKKNNKKITDFTTVKCNTITMDKDDIEELLSRLTYPFILKNYDILWNLLSQPATFHEDEFKFNIIENNRLVAMVYKNCKEEIPTWIETYGYNICTDNKMDGNHMFSFGVDILLIDLWKKKSNAVKCKYKIINEEKHATCIYIYGKAFINEKWERGNFEYFLNDKNILFHRLFRPDVRSV